MNTFRGYFGTRKYRPLTYIAFDGVRNHYPPQNTHWSDYPGSNFLTGELYDAITGKLTDRFYGNCNDFNLWFIGKVTRSEAFDVYITFTDEPEKLKMDQVLVDVGCGANYEEIMFNQDSTGKWYEDIDK